MRAAVQLSSVDDIHLAPLPAGTALRISRSAAERTALREFPMPHASGVSAYAVLDTDNAWQTRQPDGKMVLKIANRPVWVVLIPHTTIRVPATGQSPRRTITASLAVYVDANTGRALKASTFYP
jgi:hypothetical protein